MGEQQRVVAAACKVGGLTFVGARHCDIWMQGQILSLPEDVQESIQMRQDTQGFIDNQGRFLTRKEGWIVAERAGQILYRCGGDSITINGEVIGILYSENLY